MSIVGRLTICLVLQRLRISGSSSLGGLGHPSCGAGVWQPPLTNLYIMSFILSAGAIALIELVASIYAASWLFMAQRSAAGR